MLKPPPGAAFGSLYATPHLNSSIYYDEIEVVEVSSGVTAEKFKQDPETDFVAEPNPLPVCDGSGRGVVTLRWKTRVNRVVEIRVGAPDGPLMARQGYMGSAPTGKWVGNGTTFFLQDATTASSITLATVRVDHSSECPESDDE